MSIIIFENDGYTETATDTGTKAETATNTETKADAETTTATATNTPSPQSAETATRREQQKQVYEHHHTQTRHRKPPQAPQRPHTARTCKTNTGHGARLKTPYKAISGATRASAAKHTARKPNAQYISRGEKQGRNKANADMTHTRRNFSFFKMIIFMRSFFKMTRSRRADHFSKCIIAGEKINDDRHATISRSCAGEIRHFSK